PRVGSVGDQEGSRAGNRRIPTVGHGLRLIPGEISLAGSRDAACDTTGAAQIKLDSAVVVKEIQIDRVAAARRERGAARIGSVERDGDRPAVLAAYLVGAVFVTITLVDCEAPGTVAGSLEDIGVVGRHAAVRVFVRL